MKKKLLVVILFIQKNYIMLFSNCFCILLLLYIFYIRLFIEISPKLLNNLMFIFILTGIFIILFNIWLLYKNILKIKKIYIKNIKMVISNKKNTNKLQKVIFKLYLMKKKVLYAFLLTYEKIIEKVLKKPFLLEKLYYKPTLFVIKLSIIYTKLCYYIIFILPKLFVTIVFFLEVIIFKEINLFYKTLWVLIIPIIGKTIRYAYRHIAYIIVDEFEDYFFITTKKPLSYNKPLDKEIVYQFLWINPQVKKQFGKESLKEYENLYIEYKTHYNYWDYTYDLENKKETIINDIIISLLLIISWLYIVINYTIITPPILAYFYFFFVFYI